MECHWIIGKYHCSVYYELMMKLWILMILLRACKNLYRFIFLLNSDEIGTPRALRVQDCIGGNRIMIEFYQLAASTFWYTLIGLLSMSEAIGLQFMIYFDETGVGELHTSLLKIELILFFFLQFKYRFKISQLIIKTNKLFSSVCCCLYCNHSTLLFRSADAILYIRYFRIFLLFRFVLFYSVEFERYLLPDSVSLFGIYHWLTFRF